MRIDFLRQRPFVALAIVGAVLGFAAGVVPPPATDAIGDRTADAAWSLPSVQGTARDGAGDLAAVRQSRIWSGDAATSGSGANWRMVGVVAEGERRIALVLVNGSNELLRLGNGDPLPGGGQVVDVGRYGMRINIFGCENLILRLYVPGQRTPASNCGYAADAGSQPARGRGLGRQAGPRTAAGAQRAGATRAGGPRTGAGRHNARRDRADRPRPGNRPAGRRAGARNATNPAPAPSNTPRPAAPPRSG